MYVPHANFSINNKRWWMHLRIITLIISHNFVLVSLLKSFSRFPTQFGLQIVKTVDWLKSCYVTCCWLVWVSHVKLFPDFSIVNFLPVVDYFQHCCDLLFALETVHHAVCSCTIQRLCYVWCFVTDRHCSYWQVGYDCRCILCRLVGTGCQELNWCVHCFTSACS